MEKKASHQTLTTAFVTAILTLTFLHVLVWRGAITATSPSIAPTGRGTAKMLPRRDIAPTSTAPATQKTVGMPTRIIIPSIALDATVENVALTGTGSMDVPKLPFDTGWYEFGPRPGETGSATIAGHVNWTNGSAAVFANLHKVRSGDKVAVQDENGTVFSFVIRESHEYEPSADAREIFVSNDGKSHLNIITCSGTWDKLAGQYTKRLVVFADKETE